MRDIAKSYDNLELYTFTGFYKKTPFSLQRRFRTRSLM